MLFELGTEQLLDLFAVQAAGVKGVKVFDLLNPVFHAIRFFTHGILGFLAVFMHVRQ